MNRKWRIFKKPGGVAVRSEIYYEIAGAKMQIENGDCTEEEPQWNDLGAVDYLGKANWHGHMAWKGKSKEEAWRDSSLWARRQSTTTRTTSSDV
jgi:AP-3 complex subunit delta-1